MTSRPTYINRPLLIVAFCSCVGLLLGRQLRCCVWWIVAATLIMLTIVIFVKSTKVKTVIFCLLIVMSFAVMGIQHNRPGLRCLMDRLDKQVVIVEGEIINFKNIKKNNKSMQVVIKIKTIQLAENKFRLNKKLKLSIYKNTQKLKSGSTIKVKGLFHVFNKPCNPGQFDYRAYMKLNNILGWLSVYGENEIKIIKEPSIINPELVISRLVTQVENRIECSVNQQTSTWLKAVLLGNRSEMNLIIQHKIALSGLAHLLAVSGLHITIVGLVMIVFLRVTAMPQPVIMFITLSGLIIMVNMIGNQVSAGRAVIMFACGIIVWLNIRKKDAWSSWALALVLILLINPKSILSAGFQLTFVATAAILYCWPRLKNNQNKIWQWLINGIFLSMAIMAATAMLTIYHFNLITPVAIINNIVAIPLLACLIVTGYVMVIGSFIHPVIGIIMGQISEWSVVILNHLVTLTAAWRFGHIVLKSPPAVVILGWYGLFFICLFTNINKTLKQVLLVTATVIIITVILPRGTTQFQVTALALNQGEATIIDYNNKIVMIDCGTEKDFIYQVYPYLKHRGIEKLDLLMVSHEDSDHSGGLNACLELLKVKKCIVAGRWLSDAVLTHKDKVDFIQLYRGENFKLAEDININCLWPPKGTVQASNIRSLVAEVIIKDKRLLFTGDSPSIIENYWVPKGKCFLLKAAHHGDAAATSQVLLTRYNPEMVLITAGRKNAYGLPDPEILKRLTDYQTLIFNTKKNGAIRISINDKEQLKWQYW